MIARRWRGQTRAADADTYLEYTGRTGLTALRAAPGNLAVFCLRSLDGDRARFEVWSLWESEEAIRAYAGDDTGAAVFYPGDDEYLLDKGERVVHYDVVFHDGAARPGRLLSRNWWGVTDAVHSETYLRYMHDTGLTALRATPGNQAVFCLRRIVGDRAEFRVWSLWESEEAIRAFAGEDPGQARYYPQDQQYLIDKDDRVEQLDVVSHEGEVPALALDEARPA